VGIALGKLEPFISLKYRQTDFFCWR